MKLSVFVGTSLDGFIARRNGTYDFLPTDGGDSNGYNEFIATVDAIIIGRKTFETVLAFPQWPYGKRRIVVLSSRAIDFSSLRKRLPPGAVVEQMSGSPVQIASRLASSGAQHAYVDGGITIQGFLCAGLIQRITITRVPVLIGEGIPLFASLPRDVKLRHIATQTYSSGLVKSEYEVVP
jgi:dihydrofolate reductase